MGESLPWVRAGKRKEEKTRMHGSRRGDGGHFMSPSPLIKKTAKKF